MSVDLSGQVAVVTGGNGGIGLGMAEGLAAAGADVAVWARNVEKSQAAVETLTGLGVRSIAVACDVADEASVAGAVADTLAGLGRIDICVANAGASGMTPLLDMTLDEWHRVMRVNVDGVMLTVRDCARVMVDQGDGGAIVAVSSTSAIHGAGTMAHYSASKSAVLGFVRAAAVALAKDRIRVNAIVPGWTVTELSSAGYENERFREVTTSRTPVRRWADASEFREVAAYLCDRSMTFHTGDSLVVDGGYTIF